MAWKRAQARRLAPSSWPPPAKGRKEPRTIRERSVMTAVTALTAFIAMSFFHSKHKKQQFFQGGPSERQNAEMQFKGVHCSVTI
ncbi:hypothetical protein BOX15_Mlig004060g1 [Macrostomum lignano]|uniref:Uncharacterized protein n=1 Tax=Macrostomum lignano TaxID=282301 RepID=A0A267DHP2_9PLAT|nr:hypothetical protein BOX15_Mlig004060g1 [Macrostomum lignano]